MKKLIVALLITLFCTPIIPAIAAETPKTEEQKTLHAIGQTISRQLAVFSLSPEELEYVIDGLKDAQSGKKSDVDIATYNNKIQEMARARRKAQADKRAPINKEYLEKAAKEPGAVKTESGLVYVSLKEGTGAQPKPSDSVKVNYRGTLPDGKEFDSSYTRGKPIEFRLDGVIKCWTEGLQKMKVGGKARLVCPSSLAYGETGAGDQILPGATLAFEVELLDIKAKQPAPAAP